MSRDIWQSYDCPVNGVDFDLFDARLVFRGQPIQCSACGQSHIAGTDVSVETGVDIADGQGSISRKFYDLPCSAEELQRIVAGGTD